MNIGLSKEFKSLTYCICSMAYLILFVVLTAQGQFKNTDPRIAYLLLVICFHAAFYFLKNYLDFMAHQRHYASFRNGNDKK